MREGAKESEKGVRVRKVGGCGREKGRDPPRSFEGGRREGRGRPWEGRVERKRCEGVWGIRSSLGRSKRVEL